MDLFIYTVITFLFYFLCCLGIRWFMRWVKDGRYRRTFNYGDDVILKIAIACTVLDVVVTHFLL